MSQMQPFDPHGQAPHPMAPPDWGQMQAGWRAPMPVSDQRPVNGAVVAIAWVLAVLSLGYLLPWAVAATRGRSNQAAIGVLNLFLGWSVIGWIVALVMACQAHQTGGGATTVIVAQQFPNARFQGPPSTPQGLPAAGWYPSTSGPGQQYWDGWAWTEHRAP